MKMRPEIKQHLKDTAHASRESITAYVERLVIEDMRNKADSSKHMSSTHV